MFDDSSKLKAATASTEQLFTLWTDLTMVYQHEFQTLWEAYRLFRLHRPSAVMLAKETGAKPVEEHDFDGLRLIMHNYDKQFVDVPIVAVQSDQPDEQEWIMTARTNETSKAFAIAFVMRDMAESISLLNEESKDDCQGARDEVVSKLTFMQHYIMNFRSKHTRELKTNVRRKVITSEEHELGTSHLASIAFALKETRTVLDRVGIRLKGQIQGEIVESHQKWVHLNEVKAEEKRQSQDQKQREENKL